MKNLFSNASQMLLKAITIILFFGITSCNLITKDKAEGQTKTDKRTLLVFFKDQSASIKTDSSSIDPTIKWIKGYLNNYLKPNTDILVTAIDNYSSVTTTNHHYFLWKTQQDERQNEEVKSEEELQLEQLEQATKSKSKIRSTKNLVIQQLFFDKLEHESSNQTAILETLPYLAKLNYDSIRIVYLCDLIQESKRRDFTKTAWPIPSKEFAQNLANEDVQKLIKEFNILNGFEKVKSISVLIPKSASKANLNNLNYYWDKLFLQLGFKQKTDYVTGVF